MGKHLRGGVQNHQQVAGGHVMNLHPLLQDSSRFELSQAKLIEFLVIEVGLARDPDGTHLDADQVIRIAR